MAVERVAECSWNRWPDHRGISDRMRPEYAPHYARATHRVRAPGIPHCDHNSLTDAVFLPNIMHIGYIERLTGSMLLQPVGEAEGIIELKALKHVQSTAEDDFPAEVGADVTIVKGVRGVVGPGELNAHLGARVGDFLQAFCLTIAVELVFNRYYVNSHLVIGAFLFADGLHEFH